MCDKCRIDLPIERWRNFLRNVDHSQEDQIKGQKIQRFTVAFLHPGHSCQWGTELQFPLPGFSSPLSFKRYYWTKRHVTKTSILPSSHKVPNEQGSRPWLKTSAAFCRKGSTHVTVFLSSARSHEFEFKNPAHKSGSSVSCWMFL